MGTYELGTNTEIYFAGLKIAEATGFSADTSVTWSEQDFIGNPVKQFIPIKVDSTGTIDKIIMDWQMFALALGYTYYGVAGIDDLTGNQFFKNGENDSDVLWRYLEIFEAPHSSDVYTLALPGVSPLDLPIVLTEALPGRCPEIEFLKVKASWDNETTPGDIIFELVDEGAVQYATFTIASSGLVAGSSPAWVSIAPDGAGPTNLLAFDATTDEPKEYRIRIAAVSDAVGDLVMAKSFKYIASSSIRCAFVLRLMQEANDEGFEIRVLHRKEDGTIAYVEDYTGVKLTKNGFSISPSELTTVSIDWYAGGYSISAP